MKWIGQMPTSRLNDGDIHPTEYRKWADARLRFERRSKDRDLVDELKVSVRQHGLKKPIIIGIDDRYHDLYVGDGHHRAIALMELGVRQFPFQWYWIKTFGVHMEHKPFPFHLTPR